MRKLVSLFLKIVITTCAIIGVILSVLDKTGAFMSRGAALLYFTIQSNIWIALVALIGIFLLVYELIMKKSLVNKTLLIIKVVFTVSITLTGFVFCFVLFPADPGLGINLVNFLTHVIVPIASIVDLFVEPYDLSLNNKHCLWSAIPPVYYLIFASIGYVNNWNFGFGDNFPYFFMNWGSEAGAFGFSKDLPFIGVFYWVILITIFVLAISYLYIKIINKINKK